MRPGGERAVLVGYDACVIGAGVDGLTAAITLARAGLNVIAVERAERCGGRAATREFYPGFRASLYADELAAIPAFLFWSLGMAKHGAVLMPSSASLALWPDRHSAFLPWTDENLHKGLLAGQISGRLRDIVSRARADAPAAARRALLERAAEPAPWPARDWARLSLAELLGETVADEAARSHWLADALAGRAGDPFLAGTALHLLAPGSGRSGVPIGGLGALGQALRAAARAAGVEISLGLEVADIRRRANRTTGVGLADGTEIQSRAVLSSLDLKRTFLSLVAWNELPPTALKRAGAMRQSGSTARLLFALDAMPALPAGEDRHALLRGPIHIAPAAQNFADAHAAWRGGILPENPPISLRIVSASDPGLAPPGAAVATAMVGAVPYRLFDGPWSHERRRQLRDRVLSGIETVLPGFSTRVRAAEVIVPPDIEDGLGHTAGDLLGGEIAADQMLDLRAFADFAGGRTPIAGLYLGGPSASAGPFAAGLGGFVAASSLLADLKARRLR